MKIDFVIAWVDGADKKWQEEKSKYTGVPAKDSDVRYRDMGVLKYWFRAVEQNAPWVNKIHFVTCGQKPDWLNENNDKLNLVNHAEYIPTEYLPTFSSRTIELNFHRIEGLSEHFVYFNDDIFINNNVKPTDFFENEQPKISAVLSTFAPTIVNDSFLHMLCNDISFMNTHFNKKDTIRKNLKKWITPAYGKYIIKNVYNYFAPGGFSMIHNFHSASPMLKSTYEKVWELEPELLHKTSKNKLRTNMDVNQYIMTYYDIGTGNFVPRDTNMSKYYEIGNSAMIVDDIISGKHKLICINDSETIKDFESVQKQLTAAFEKRYPTKSSFEV